MVDFIKKKQEKRNFKDPNNEMEIKKEKIELNFDLINGEPNYSYTLLLNTVDNKIESNLFSNPKPNQLINFFKYSCDYSFGKEQKLDLLLEIKNFNDIEKYPINTTIGEIIGSENSKKKYKKRNVGNKSTKIKKKS